MSTVYKLPYTGNEIKEKIGQVDKNTTAIGQLSEHIEEKTSELKETLANDYIQNKINIYTRAHTPVNTSTSDFWYTYHTLTLKAGVTYVITTKARNCGNTFRYALMNTINNYVENVYSVVDDKPIGDNHTIVVTPQNDSIILFKDIPFSSPFETLELKRTNQDISEGTFVSFVDWSATTLAFDLTVDALITPNELFNVLHRKPYIVSKNGDGNFTTISDAILNTEEDDTILIMSGIYTEQVKMYGKNRHLIGLSKESVFVVNTGKLYGSEPIQANMGSIENMTIIGGYGLAPIDKDVDSTSYAIHIEYPNSTDFELKIENCNIISNVAPAIGMGIRHNQKVIIKDCFIETKAKEMYSSAYSNYFNCGAIFCHNDASDSNLGTDGYLSVENCELKGVLTALTLQSQNNGNTLTHRFLKNTLWSTTNGKENAVTLRTTPTSGHLVGSDGVLDGISFGNNVSELNA